jgi:hypothetical protein
MERVRASADSHMKYEAYFTYILSKVEEYSILPEQTYNMDEKGIALGMMDASTRIFSRKQWDRKQVRAPIHDGSREWITILACICADGSALPPALIYQSDASNVQSSWVEDINLEQAAFVTASKSGWTNNDIGLQWLIQVFDRLTKPKARLQWRLLYVDGHASHVSVEFLDYCVKSRILVARFPPHATHTVQPLDVVVFRSLSAAYNRALTRTSTFPGQRKVDFHRFFVQTRLKCLRKSVSQPPPFAAGVVAGALPYFVFQLFAELKSCQNGPCATQFYTFG